MLQNVDQSFECFEERAQRFGLTCFHDTNANSRVAWVERNSAKFRLSWDATQQHLCLEITHGPALTRETLKTQHTQSGEARLAATRFPQHAI